MTQLNIENIQNDNKISSSKANEIFYLKKVCHILLPLLLNIVFINNIYAQQVLGDTLTADFKYLINLLEETHPDPYTGFGGKVFFHNEASDIEQQLKNGATLDEFTSLVLSFMSKLEDGHTSIDRIQSNTDVANLSLPIEFMVMQDGLFVSKISNDKEKFIGSKFHSINGISLNELCKELGKLRPMENIYGKYDWLSIFIKNYRQMKYLLPDMQEKASIVLETLNGNIETIELMYIDKDSCENIKMAENPKFSKIQNVNFLFHDYLDKDKQAMYFKMSAVMAKEPFSYMRTNAWNNMENMLKDFYTYDLKKEIPANIDEAIAAIPNLSDIFRQMLEKMKTDNAKYLIIDLRGNGGGFTPIIYPTLYMLYGDNYLEKDMNVSLYRLISDLYLKKINTTLENFNQNKTNYQIGDYISLLSFDENINIVERRRILANNSLGEAADYIKDLGGKPVYSPEKIFVVTNPQTFSAAFHYAFYLWKMGAILIGVPSGQAPNAYMEITPFQLPLTKINGSISNSFQVFLPANDKRAKIFYPDIMLNWKDYKKYDFNKDSDLLHLLELLELNLPSDLPKSGI